MMSTLLFFQNMGHYRGARKILHEMDCKEINWKLNQLIAMWCFIIWRQRGREKRRRNTNEEKRRHRKVIDT